MNKEKPVSPAMEKISHPRFTAFYNRMMERPLIRNSSIPCGSRPLGKHKGSSWKWGLVEVRTSRFMIPKRLCVWRQ